jgi:hypothetical protein
MMIMDFHDSVADFHTVAVSTEDADNVFVLTDSGWRCYRTSHAPVPTGTLSSHLCDRSVVGRVRLCWRTRRALATT